MLLICIEMIPKYGLILAYNGILEAKKGDFGRRTSREQSEIIFRRA